MDQRIISVYYPIREAIYEYQEGTRNPLEETREHATQVIKTE